MAYTLNDAGVLRVPLYIHIYCSSGQQAPVETKTSIQMTWSETFPCAVFPTFWTVWTVLFTAQNRCTLSHCSESAIGWTSKDLGFCCWQGEKTFSSPKHLYWPWDPGTHPAFCPVGTRVWSCNSPPSSKGVTFKSLWMPWGHVAVWRYSSTHF